VLLLKYSIHFEWLFPLEATNLIFALSLPQL